MPPPFITIVTGLPRSGTSMMMRMLEAGGLPALTDHARPADAARRRTVASQIVCAIAGFRVHSGVPWLRPTLEYPQTLG